MAQPGLFLDELSLGMTAEMTRLVTEADVIAFANVTGDHNPAHLDAAYAATTPFRERIAHGMLIASYLSAVMGEHLPGPGAIYVSQTINFLRPVKLNSEVTARAEVVEIDLKMSHVRLACACLVKGKAVLKGEAVAIPRRRPRGGEGG